MDNVRQMLIEANTYQHVLNEVDVWVQVGPIIKIKTKLNSSSSGPSGGVKPVFGRSTTRLIAQFVVECKGPIGPSIQDIPLISTNSPRNTGSSGGLGTSTSGEDGHSHGLPSHSHIMLHNHVISLNSLNIFSIPFEVKILVDGESTKPPISNFAGSSTNFLSQSLTAYRDVKDGDHVVSVWARTKGRAGSILDLRTLTVWETETIVVPDQVLER